LAGRSAVRSGPPLAISVGIATVAYGAVPDLGTVGLFALLYMTVPALYVALTLGLGSFIKATAGIAAIGFVVALLPTMLGSLVPIIAEVSPTAIGGWPSETPQPEDCGIHDVAHLKLPTPDFDELESERFDLSKDSVECGLVRDPAGEHRLAAILPG